MVIKESEGSDGDCESPDFLRVGFQSDKPIRTAETGKQTGNFVLMRVKHELLELTGDDGI